MNFDVIILLVYLVCYVTFGLKGGARFIDKVMAGKLTDPKKLWVRYVLIGIAALFFAWFEFGRLVISGIIALVGFIVGRR